MHLHPRQFCDFDFKIVYGACGVCDSLLCQVIAVSPRPTAGIEQIIDPVEMDLNEAPSVLLSDNLQDSTTEHMTSDSRRGF